MEYLFQLTLTKNITAFERGVQSSELTGNVDDPESGRNRRPYIIDLEHC